MAMSLPDISRRSGAWTNFDGGDCDQESRAHQTVVHVAAIQLFPHAESEGWRQLEQFGKRLWTNRTLGYHSVQLRNQGPGRGQLLHGNPLGIYKEQRRKEL